MRARQQNRGRGRGWVVVIAAAAGLAASPAAGQGANLPELPLRHMSLDGEISAGVWITVDVGSPPQQSALLFDTGSSTLAVSPPNVVALYGASSCEVCPASFGDMPCQYPICSDSVSSSWLRNEGQDVSASGRCVIGGFNPTQSSTFYYLPSTPTSSNMFTTGQYACNTASANGARCEACVQYGFQSGVNCGQGFAGDLATDVVSIGGINTTVSFVAIDLIQAAFQVPPTSGIIGAAFTNDLPANPAAYSAPTPPYPPTTRQPVALDLLLLDNGLDNAFSMCMGSPTNPGVLVLGGESSGYRTDAFATVPMVTNSGAYGVSIDFFSVGPLSAVNTVSPADAESVWAMSGQQEAMDGSVPIVDSGTPQLLVPTALFNAVPNPPQCVSNDDCNIFVHLTGGANLTVPGALACENGYCSPTGWLSTQDGTSTILGYAVLRNYYTLFHRDPSNPHFGFAPASASCRAGADVPAPRGGASGSSGKANEKLSVGDDVGIAIAGGVVVCAAIVIALYAWQGRKVAAARAPSSAARSGARANPAYRRAPDHDGADYVPL